VESLRRFDERVARVEGALAVVVLLGMVVIASFQALVTNIAERGVGWAQVLLGSLSWVDVFLQKGTLWIAFLGASLATQKDKHIAVDLLQRLATPRISAMVRVVASLGAGIIAFVLARVFFQACLIADEAIPLEFEALAPSGPVHVCDAPPEMASTIHRPGVFCALRAGLAALHVPISSYEGIAQMIAPLMFVVIGVRLLARALSLALALSRGETPEPPHAQKQTDPATIDTPAHEPSKPLAEAPKADAEAPEPDPDADDSRKDTKGEG
jgi:TRAP-type C4-dicarboxylate transport system permease small subunit